MPKKYKADEHAFTVIVSSLKAVHSLNLLFSCSKVSIITCWLDLMEKGGKSNSTEI